jgi:hypothetical protein
VTVLALACVASCGRLGFDAEQRGASDANSVDAATSGREGFWIVREVLLRGEAQTRSRDDLVSGVRADVVISERDVDLRALVLERGVPDRLILETLGLEIVADQWLISNADFIGVFGATWLTPDVLELVYVPDAPGNQGGPPGVERFVIERADPLPSEMVGVWSVATMAYAGTGEFAAGACAPDGGDKSWRVTGQLEISPRFLISVRFEFQYYEDSSCMDLAMSVEDRGVGYHEVDSTTFRTFLSTDLAEHASMTGTITGTANGYRWDQTTCFPSDECSKLPLMLELEQPTALWSAPHRD